jgi:oxygen-independent coproporphyrinogen III oxidase
MVGLCTGRASRRARLPLLTVLQFLPVQTLGLYIQVPFCQTKCTYCNFHTDVVSSDRFAPYISAVRHEISHHAELFASAGISWPKRFDWQDLRQVPHEPRRADTVYIGGGTPSLLDPRLLGGLLESLRQAFACSGDEVTLEADPETIESAKAQQWLAAGINRISFGSQSFNDEELKAAGRKHRRADIYRAVPILRSAGIANISFDLIAGLPKQTHNSWRQSLAEAIALSPEHISIYMMEIDEGSRLGLEVIRSGPRYSAHELPSEEAMAEFYELAQAELQSAGYEQYEISNWAKPGYTSQHNLKYWRRQPYLGFGAGAHSFSGKQRWGNLHDAAAYVAAISAGRSAIEHVDALTPRLALEEEIFLGLRQLCGIDVGRIESQYGVDLQHKIGRFVSNGIIERVGSLVRLAPGKLSISTEVLVELLR